MPDDLLRFPSSLALKAFAGDRPLASAMFQLFMPTTKNPVSFLVGPSDEDGELQLSRDELERRYRQEVRTALMDYRGWSGEIFVQVANRTTIERARLGLAYYRGAMRALFPADYEDHLDRAEQSLAGHDRESLRVVASAPEVSPMVQSA